MLLCVCDVMNGGECIWEAAVVVQCRVHSQEMERLKGCGLYNYHMKVENNESSVVLNIYLIRICTSYTT